MEDLGDSCCVRHLKYNIRIIYVQMINEMWEGRVDAAVDWEKKNRKTDQRKISWYGGTICACVRHAEKES